MVFQSYALYPHMTVFDNMAFGLKLRKIAKDEIRGRVDNAARLLDIEPLLKRRPGQLSGGQRQRVALGRAIVREPAAFLLDEPLSNLDAKLRVQTRAEISKLHERLGTTFVYVTHDQVEAMTMATRIAVLNEGILQQVGTPQQLYDLPTNLFVAGFIGSPAMNFMDVDLRRDGDSLVFDAGGFVLPVPEALAPRLRDHAGRLVLGIRPDDIHDPDYPRLDITPHAVDVTVDVVEPMGSETVLHLIAGGLSLVARVDPRTSASVGRPMFVLLDLANLHVFDPESGLALDADPLV